MNILLWYIVALCNSENNECVALVYCSPLQFGEQLMSVLLWYIVALCSSENNECVALVYCSPLQF